MTFETESTNKEFQLNLVLDIDGIKYSQYQVDSGLVVDADKLGVVDNVRINPFSVDVRSVRTTIQSLSFQMLDLDEVISLAIGNSANQLMDSDVILYVGFITGAFDFSDYIEISRTKIKTITKSANRYSFSAKEVTDQINSDMFTTEDVLDSSISDVATSLDLQGFNIDDFPSSGKVKIDNEFIVYTTKVDNTLGGLSRGDKGTEAKEHDSGDSVLLVTEISAVNPIDFMLQLMVSPGGGGVYDVLDDGLGISETLIDIAGFEAIRDVNFPSDLYEFTMFKIGNGLKFLESELMLATNTRVYAKDGLISLAILDQIVLGASVPIMDESTITSQPRWGLNVDKIVNKVIMRYNFDPGSGKYTRTETFENTESINTFGLRKTLEYKFKGIRASENGATIVADRATRLLERLSTPRARIQVSTHFDQVNNNVGDNIELQHRHLPAQGGGLGFSEQLEVLSRAVDFKTGKVNFTLEFTSYSGLRIGLICPSPFISTITSQLSFSVDDGTCYAIGYTVRIFDTLTNSYEPDTFRTITSVVGNVITVDTAFSTTLLTTHKLKFSIYDNASGEQRSKYAFIAPNTGFFDDGSKAYQIIF